MFSHKTFFMIYNAIQLTLINLKLCDLYDLNNFEHNIKIKNLKK